MDNATSPERKSSSGTLIKVVLTGLALAASVWAVIAIDGRSEDPGKADPIENPTAAPVPVPMPVPDEPPAAPPEPPVGETVLYPAAPPEVLAGIELIEDPRAEALPGGAVHEVLLTRESAIWFGGVEVGPGVLPNRFAKLAGPGADPAVLIAADRAVPWKTVTDVLRACAAAGRARVFVRCAGETDRALPFPIPVIADIAVDPLFIEVRSRDGVTEVDIRLRRMAIRPLERMLPDLVEDLEMIREERGLDAVRIKAWQDLPFADVLSVAAAAREAGFVHVLTSRVGNAQYDPTDPMASVPRRSTLPPGPVVPDKDSVKILTESLPAWKRVDGTMVLRAAKERVRNSITLPTVGSKDEHEGFESLLEIAITSDRGLFVAGEMVTLDVLKEVLFGYADRNRDEDDPLEPSKLAVILVVDQDALWRDVQWAMQVCADPAVRAPRIYLAARSERGGEIAIKAFLPIDRILLEEEQRPKVEIKRTYGEPISRLTWMSRPVGAGDAAFGLLAEKVRMTSPASVELHAWAAVPFKEALRVIADLHDIGITEITFVGAPPPR